MQIISSSAYSLGVRVGLIGCVKTKRATPGPAMDLYLSALFNGRRKAVEASCDSWFILSAKHGLLQPTEIIEPYDLALTSLSRTQQELWSQNVVQSLVASLGDLNGFIFEIHAGSEYRNFGVIDGLQRLGATVINPTVGLTFGEQLRFYRSSVVMLDMPTHLSPSRLGGSLHADVDRFYRSLAELSDAVGGARALSRCTGRMEWPVRGVYFIFEPDEMRADGVTQRVVRVGTHALGASSSTLWGRISQHRGVPGGSTPGGGNHRGSVFRRHVGSAILASGDWPSSIAATWGVGNNATQETKKMEYPLEVAVSQRIGEMSVICLPINDPPSRASLRGIVERGAIGLLSRATRESLDTPSLTWLGRSSDRESIRSSGLWNVNHTDDDYDNTFFDHLDELVNQTVQRH
ncbi:unannotated protein [freshwater metagenome]|uniref:Unannotated protein n=1 Tax=freshwater metagenome TaxID=449393 RepID=A0A6J6WRA5_9ZZZZ